MAVVTTNHKIIFFLFNIVYFVSSNGAYVRAKIVSFYVLQSIWPLLNGHLQNTHTQAIGVVMLGYGIGSLLNIVDFGFFTQAGFIAGSAIFIGVGALKIVFSIMGMIQVGITRSWIFSIVSNLYTSFVHKLHTCGPFGRVIHHD